jgi:hypothetical protein
MINVFFSGSGTWFDKNNGNLIYPVVDESRSYFSLPPRHMISGIFSITHEDAEIYRFTNNLDHVRKLFPKKHPDSAFLKMVNEGVFINEDIQSIKNRSQMH